jgi:NAD(P)-dependent dehydrogenase (short-subunit alcohol dehydrogenase family)
MELSGTSVAVTGGANGIGRAIARRFADAGARVAIGDIDGSGAEAAAAELPAAIGVALDVTEPEAYAAFLDAAESAHGPLGVLVNNAGVDWIGSFHEEPDEVSRREVEINLLGTIYGTRLAVQRMLPRGHGHVVNVASGVGRVPLPGSAVYSATKHGIVGLTESVRLEYRDSGLGFSLIQPAQVETGMLAGQGRPKLLPQIAPEDVADAVVDAVRRGRFEVWVPASQGISAKLGNALPRALRERVILGLGVDRIAGDTDAAARREYHQRMFGRS